MPVVTTEVIRIKCDNPNCPGNDLDESDRTGWLFVSAGVYGGVYGSPVQESVFCSVACVNAATAEVPTLLTGEPTTPPGVPA